MQKIVAEESIARFVVKPRLRRAYSRIYSKLIVDYQPVSGGRMMNQQKTFLILAAVIFCLGSGLALADDHMALAGERLSKTCASCHGTAGASPGKLIPIIGGQKSAYIATVLSEFAADKRPGSVMSNLAKGYSGEEQKQIAAYFSAQDWVNTEHAPPMTGPPALIKSCQGCHAKNGEGQGSFPRLAGQHPEYLFEALGEYKKGERTAGTMMLIKGIDESNLKDLANYYSALR